MHIEVTVDNRAKTITESVFILGMCESNDYQS